MKRVVIIGGGIAGLATAYSLREHSDAPFEIRLIERKDRLGGNIRTERENGFLIEGGPDCFLSEKPWAMELCKRVGLGDELLPTNEQNRKTFVLSRGNPRPPKASSHGPHEDTAARHFDLISVPGKIRMALELFVPKRKGQDESLGIRKEEARGRGA